MERSEQIAVEWTKAQPAVAAYISSLITDFHQAEEVLHQVAVILVRKFDQYDEAHPFVAWALGIARLEVLKHRRKHATDRHVFSDKMVDKIEGAYERLSDQFDVRRQALANCIEKVESRDRELLRLRYIEDLRPIDIAAKMDVTPGSLRTLLHRTRGALRDCIEKRVSEMERRS